MFFSDFSCFFKVLFQKYDGINNKMRKLKFIDLFAGLGGFHLALQSLGHDCVFASELNSELRDLYEKNHNTKIEGDINLVDVNKIPSHDILCAGFPAGPDLLFRCDKNRPGLRPRSRAR